MAHAEGGYYVPHFSFWPIFGGVALTSMAAGASIYLNGSDWGFTVMMIGVALTLLLMAGWFANVIRESVSGLYNTQVDRSFRWGMMWFIFSEVMFFGAFFGALFYARMLSVPWISGADPSTARFLWDSVTLNWPTAGPA